MIRPLAVLLISFSSLALAQEGPTVPCVDCEILDMSPYPESGLWYNPQQSGSGLNLEVQGGRLAGYYYGYDQDGDPEWRLFSGELLPSELPGVQWELSATLLRFSGGNCVGCDHVAPEYTETDSVKLEFSQRNALSIAIGEHAPQNFVPLTFGTRVKTFFPDYTEYRMPDFDEPAQFLVYTRVDTATETASTTQSNRGDVQKPKTTPAVPTLRATQFTVKRVDSEPGELRYRLTQRADPLIARVYDIVCSVEEGQSAPGCLLEFEERLYRISLGNFGATRFFGKAVDGGPEWVEGQRIAHD